MLIRGMKTAEILISVFPMTFSISAQKYNMFLPSIKKRPLFGGRWVFFQGRMSLIIQKVERSIVAKVHELSFSSFIRSPQISKN